MKNLKRLSAVFTLTLALGVSAFAGEMQTPPCAPPAPGIMETPPCAGQAMPAADPTDPGIMQGPPASRTETAYSFAEAAMTLFESALLF